MVVGYETHISPSGAAILCPKGRLNFVNAKELQRRLLGLITPDQNRIIVDLSKTESADSTAIGVIVGGLKASRMHGGDLCIAGLNESLAERLRWMNIHRFVRVYATPDEADSHAFGKADSSVFSDT